jgi:hypothetical protein
MTMTLRRRLAGSLQECPGIIERITNHWCVAKIKRQWSFNEYPPIGSQQAGKQLEIAPWVC